MKKILITGKTGYIGNKLITHLDKEKYNVTTISLRTDDWKTHSFSNYDTIIHLSGLVHSKKSKSYSEYNRVNYELTLELANVAKLSGVKHFIFMSSMSVYGDLVESINYDTEEKPQTYYGKSKLAAERAICDLSDATFTISIIRPPMVYGKDCKGNYNTISKIANNLILFPNVVNKRSMIYIDNLCEYIRITVDYSIPGIIFPQNNEYVSTSNLYSQIRKSHNKKTILLPFGSRILMKLANSKYRKVFGNLFYNKEGIYHPTRNYRGQYLPDFFTEKGILLDFEESINLTERDN